MNGDSSSPPTSRLTRVARTQKTIFRGNVDGRIRQAAPLPLPPPPPANLAGALYVGPEDPGLDGGYDYWFKEGSGSVGSSTSDLLDDTVILYESGTRSGGQIRVTATWLDAVVSYELDPAKTYTVEVDSEGKFSTQQLYLFSAIAPNEVDVDLSNWFNLGSDTGVYADTMRSVTIGPGMQEWDLAVAAGEHYLIIDCNFHIDAIRIREQGAEVPEEPITVDFPCTYFYPEDGVVYPFTDEYSSVSPEDWNPPQTEGIATNWGYIVPDTGCLETEAIVGANIWDNDGYLVDRSHGTYGADFDPARAIELSLQNPGLYGPPEGQIEADGSITWFGNPYHQTEGHWDDDGETMVIRFEGTPPVGISWDNVELVVHHMSGGSNPKLWLDWQTLDDEHRTSHVPLRNEAGQGQYRWLEDTAPLPADFPINRVFDGADFLTHFTLQGGFYYAMFAYIALRFTLGAAEPGVLQIRTPEGWLAADEV